MDFNEILPTHLPEIMPRHYASSPEHSHLVDHALQREYDEELAKLQDDEDLAFEIILHDGRTIRVTWFGYSTIEMLKVEGVMDGKEIVAFVHYATVQAIFSKFKKAVNQERKRIGFMVPGDE